MLLSTSLLFSVLCSLCFLRQPVFNEEAAKKLERLAELSAARGGDGSVFRERGFKNAAGVLRRLGTHITDVEQLKVCFILIFHQVLIT